MKKFCVCVFLFLAFSSGLFADKNVVGLEQICFVTLGSFYSPDVYSVTISDPYVQTVFKSPVLATLTIPPSKDSTLYFELSAQYFYQLVNAPQWEGWGSIWFQFLSSVIPDNIDVYIPVGIFEIHMTNNSSDRTFGALRANRTFKLEMRPDALGWCYFYYKDGRQVPEDVALSLQKKLIADGFSVDIWTEGSLTGFKNASLRPMTIEVTRTKK